MTAVTTAADAERAAAAELQTALIGHTKADNRRQVLKALKEAKFLSTIALDAIAVGDVEASEREVSSDRVVLNGINFRGSAEQPSDFLDMLRDIVRKICEPWKPAGGGAVGSADVVAADEAPAVDPGDVYEGLVLRMIRSANAADSYFKLNALLGSPDLILMPRKEAASNIPPVEVELMATEGTVHATVSCTNVYGLFRKGDLKQNFGKAQPMPYEAGSNPWISIDAVVKERVNFANGKSVRYLRVNTLES